jgi:CO/xanthine dehydrogenase Mo-binding subunit
MGRAIRAAVLDVKDQMRQLAAARLEISPHDLEIVDGGVQVRGSPDKRLPFSAVIAATRVGNVLGRGSYLAAAHLDMETGQGIGSPQWHPCVCGVEVSVDLDTGRVAIERLQLGLYVGRMINPTGCELQIQGAALFGVGQALFEELLWDETGTMLNANLSDYMIPSFLDVPGDLGQVVLETPGTIEVHGLGETGLPAVAPAVAGAVARAIGARIHDLPITPEKVLVRLRGDAGVTTTAPDAAVAEVESR